MKKVLVLLALVAAVSAYSQGTVRFSNKQIAYTNAVGDSLLKNSKVKYGAGGPVTANSNVTSVPFQAGGTTWGQFAQAALYGGAVGADASTFTLLVPAVGFLTGVDAGYWDNSDTTRAVPGIAAASDAWVQARVWDVGQACATYEAAALLIERQRYLGVSEIMQVTLGGGSPPLPAAQMVDSRTAVGTPMAAFNLSYFPAVPEPSIIGLGILGALAGLFVFRRRN